MTIFLNYMITLSHYSNNTDIRIIRVTRISALLARHKHAPVEIMFLSLDEGKKKKNGRREKKRKEKENKNREMWQITVASDIRMRGCSSPSHPSERGRSLLHGINFSRKTLQKVFPNPFSKGWKIKSLISVIIVS